MAYNWQQKDWPNFRYELGDLSEALFLFADKLGQTDGVLRSLPKDSQTDTIVDLMVFEAIKTSEIEGEYLDRKDVVSSIRNNLGLNKQAELVRDKRAIGVARFMIDVRNTYKEELNEAQIFSWHRMLFEGWGNITLGAWRTHVEPMQVISGAYGKEKVHFEAPPSDRVPSEMKAFVDWFNNTGPGGNAEIKLAPVRSAVAHLYFESIHPFEDGNGRIGRAISEKALAQGIGRPALVSISRAIEANKRAYYETLERASQSNEISRWVGYFVKTIAGAQVLAEEQVHFTLRKVKFLDRFASELNERQLVVVRKMLEEGPAGFTGGMNARKYVSLTKTSRATATRDMQDLADKGIFSVVGAGRSTRYEIVL